MKKALVLLLFCQLGLAQKLSKEKLLNQMSDEICTEMKTKKVDKNNFELTLGLVMVKSINNNKQNVERFYGDKMYGESGILEKIGEDLGGVMISRCPEMFEKLNDMGALDKYVGEIEAEQGAEAAATDEFGEDEFSFIEGNFTGTKAEGFYYVQVTEDSGKTNKFVLLDKFESSYLITDKVLKVNDKVKVLYYESELFDPKLNLFVNSKIITDIIKL